jgi:hypothetical protein
VKAAAVLLLALLAANGRAGTAYVTDELVLGVYADQATQGPRLATLHSGAAVETLAVNGEATQVRLGNGVVGWVKTVYLVNAEPATVRLQHLQEELDRTRATTPVLAEAAQRSEVERLTRELASMQAAAETARTTAEARPIEPGATNPPAAERAGLVAGRTLPLWFWAATLAAALVCGFWLGYAALARRIKDKFGGIKVY